MRFFAKQDLTRDSLASRLYKLMQVAYFSELVGLIFLEAATSKNRAYIAADF